MRREGLYPSHLLTWRGQQERAELLDLTPKQRGAVPNAKDRLAATVVALELEVTRCKARAKRAGALVELPIKVSELLGIALPGTGRDA